MVGRQSVTLSFNGRVRLENRVNHWAAYFEPLGMTVYGRTEEETLARVDAAVEFFVKHYSDPNDEGRKVRQYLDKHGVPSFVTVSDMAGPIRRNHPVRLPLEVAVNA